MKVLSEILLDGENQFQAFFENTNDQLEIAKTLIAFSNSEGGILIFGLKKNGKITGVDPEREQKCILSISKEYCSSIIEYSSRILQEEYRLLLEINVLSTTIKPVRLIYNSQNDAFVRSNRLNFKANKIQENVWKYRSVNGLKPDMFQDNEEVVKRFITNNPKSSLTKIHKNMDLSIDSVDYILVRLLCWEIIYMDLFEFGCEFSLTK